MSISGLSLHTRIPFTFCPEYKDIFFRIGATTGAGGVPERRHPVGAHRLLQQQHHLSADRAAAQGHHRTDGRGMPQRGQGDRRHAPGGDGQKAQVT